jgi:hypothetical protein
MPDCPSIDARERGDDQVDKMAADHFSHRRLGEVAGKIERLDIVGEDAQLRDMAREFGPGEARGLAEAPMDRRIRNLDGADLGRDWRHGGGGLAIVVDERFSGGDRDLPAALP